MSFTGQVLQGTIYYHRGPIQVVCTITLFVNMLIGYRPAYPTSYTRRDWVPASGSHHIRYTICTFYTTFTHRFTPFTRVGTGFKIHQGHTFMGDFSSFGVSIYVVEVGHGYTRILRGWVVLRGRFWVFFNGPNCFTTFQTMGLGTRVTFFGLLHGSIGRHHGLFKLMVTTLLPGKFTTPFPLQLICQTCMVGEGAIIGGVLYSVGGGVHGTIMVTRQRITNIIRGTTTYLPT